MKAILKTTREGRDKRKHYGLVENLHVNQLIKDEIRQIWNERRRFSSPFLYLSLFRIHVLLQIKI